MTAAAMNGTTGIGRLESDASMTSSGRFAGLGFRVCCFRRRAQ
jgi:hypothetical protein